MLNSTGLSTFLRVALSSLLFAACATEEGDEPILRPSAQQQSHEYTPPPGAHMLPADPGLSPEDALASLQAASRQKGVTGSPSCRPDWYVIEARGGGDNLVTVEWQWSGDDKGTLRASVPWSEFGSAKEAFLICDIDGAIALYSIGAGRYVSAELGWSGDRYATLRARATSVGPWERFILQPDGRGNEVIRSSANNRLVSAEFGFAGDRYGTLRARATAVGEWERFGKR